MSKEKTTPKKTQTPEIQEVENGLNAALEHHVKMRKYSGDLYSYHHQMVLHLREQIDKLKK